MTDLAPSTEPPTQADQVSLLVDAYLDGAELLTASILNLFSNQPVQVEVIVTRYLSLVTATEALLAVAGLEVPKC